MWTVVLISYVVLSVVTLHLKPYNSLPSRSSSVVQGTFTHNKLDSTWLWQDLQSTVGCEHSGVGRACWAGVIN